MQFYKMDIVILRLGRFSDVPNIPEFPPSKGPEEFKGKVIHSMDYAVMDYESVATFVKGNLHWILQWNAQQQMVKQDDLAQSINITEMVYFPIQRIDLHFDLIPGMKKPCTVLNKNER
ncbi:hypothetical protein CUMW_094570 [Citrus unshiu]|uniref:Uncharacterized protein n=1 Tax=Citrus unshiu TaxID=55188 RepID=A0A2H5P187_CITUN|nr:hypothetical protein CUMW_094570 [Citrus unshiu]